MLVGMNKGKVSKENLEGKLQEFLKKKGIEMDVESHMDAHRNVSVKALKARIEDLKKDQVEDCSVCLLPPNTIAFTVCGHIFCEECISECLDKNPICPVCKKNTETNDILVFDRETPELSAENYKPSTKSIAVIEELVKIAEKKEKCVCFTQWMGMMNILGFEMNAKGIKFVRLDGKCSNKKRTQILAQFLEDNETTVLMVSLMMGGVGLNLTKANHVLLVEPWWNPGVEIQAIDRVHRIGQKKPVHVTRYICADTIEEKILNLQEHKKGILDLTLAQCSKEDFKNMGYFLGVEFDPHGFK
jgi:SNF2 family DNA or RNA helicase